MSIPLRRDTRAHLAYFWSLVSAIALCYIIVVHGKEKEILTLIIGLIGGTILGGVFGVYFSDGQSKDKYTAPSGPAIETAENVTVNNQAEQQTNGG